jgi:hypothetical protein
MVQNTKAAIANPVKRLIWNNVKKEGVGLLTDRSKKVYGTLNSLVGRRT